MHQTPWAKKTSTLPSDRLRPKAQPAPNRTKANNGSNTKDSAEPQSKALRILRALHVSLQDPSTSGTPDPTGGCFCQARTHPLSSYTPICTGCGLPLCNLSAPAHPCPSCASPLLTPAQRTALIARVAEEIAATTLKEQQARERAEAERRAAVGAFPSLSGSTSSSGSAYPTLSSSQNQHHQHQPQQTTHKVLSLNSKTKRAVLTTTTTTPRTAASASAGASRPASPQPTREPRPGRHLDGTNTAKGKGKDRAVDPERPWANLSLSLAGKECTYVPPPRVGDDVDGDADGEVQGKGGKRRRARGKGKGKEKENVAVGGGGASGS